MNPQFTQPDKQVAVQVNKQSIARDFGVKHSAVAYASQGMPLSGYKVIYDKDTQKAYSLPPDLPSTATVVALVNGILTYNTGSVNLGVLNLKRNELVTITDTFTTGFTLTASNEVVYFGDVKYFWAGSFPKVVPAGSSIYTTGGLGSTGWKPLRELTENQNIIYATDFGVRGDGVDCGAACKAAIDYIIEKGGLLKFPSGEVNFGTTRYRNASMDGASFRIQGTGTTVWSFDNVDPTYMDITTGNYTSEPELISIGAEPTGYGRGTRFATFEISNITIDYSRQKNKGGNTYETMGVGPHPTPYSSGTAMLSVYGSYHPTVRNCTFRNCWGQALRFRKCNRPQVIDVDFLDVTSNQIRHRQTGSEASDSFGGGIFFWACQYAYAKNVTVWNTKVYVCDPSIVMNGQVVNGTPVGYIGAFAEYSPVLNNRYDTVAPGLTMFSDDNGVTIPGVDLNQYATFDNVTTYGYTIGIKSESATYVTLNNCQCLASYMPSHNASSMHITGGLFDMLHLASLKCPQAGYDSQRAVVGNGSYSGDYPYAYFLCEGATVNVSGYRAFSHAKGTNLVKNTRINVRGGATSNTLTSNRLAIISYTGCYFRYFDTNTVGNHFRFTTTDRVEFTDNVIYNESTVPIGLGTQEGDSSFDIQSNTWSGPGLITFNSACNGCVVNANEFRNGVRINAVAIRGLTINSNHWRGFPNSAGDTLISVNSCRNLSIENNSIAIVQDVVRTINGSLISFTNNNSVNVSLKNNNVSGNVQTVGWRLANLRVEIADISNNEIDGTTVPIVTWSAGAGPIIYDNNSGSTASPPTDYNRLANLSSAYVPVYGSKVSYLRPTTGGPEGMIFLNGSWYSFGNIIAGAITA